MRKIKLPVTTKFSATLDIQKAIKDLKEKGTTEPIRLNSVELSKDAAQARENGAEIIWATISIEQQIEDIIVSYLFGSAVDNPKRAFFIHNILRTNSFTFAQKKKIAFKIMSDNHILKGKEKKETQDLLKNVMNYRNAFAHGSISVDVNYGCRLSYYSNGNKTFVLNDNFWDEVENQYKKLHEILSNAKK